MRRLKLSIAVLMTTSALATPALAASSHIDDPGGTTFESAVYSQTSTANVATRDALTDRTADNPAGHALGMNYGGAINNFGARST